MDAKRGTVCRKPLQVKGFGKGQISVMAARLARDLNTTRWLYLDMPVPNPYDKSPPLILVSGRDLARCLSPLAFLSWSQGWPFFCSLHPALSHFIRGPRGHCV